MAGRPKGSTNLPKIRAYLDNNQIEKLVRISLKKAMEDNDTTMQKFLLEQVFGKAQQTLVGDSENPLNFGVIMYPNGKEKNNVETPQKTGDSTN